MKTSNFQRKAIATAVSGVLTAGLASGASALDLASGDNAYPEIGNTLFLGAPLTNIRFVSTNGTAAEAIVTGKLNYFGAGDAPLGSSVPVTDAGPGANVDISVTVGAPAGVDHAVFTVDTTGSSDTIGGFNSLFGYVDEGGELIGDDGAAAFASEAAAIAHAQVAAPPNNGRLPIDSSYTGINITDARLSEGGATPGVVYVTFNANPKIAGTTTPINGSGVAAGDYVEIKDSTIPPAAVPTTISNGAAGTPGQFLAPNQKAFIEGTTPLPVNEPQPPSSGFAGPISSAGTGANLDDGAGNGPSIVVAFAPPLPLDPPAYAATGQVAVATGAAGVLYDGAGLGSVTVTLRMNEVIAAGTWNNVAGVTDDLVTSAGADVDASATGLLPDADGNSTILRATLTDNAGDFFFIDAATGDVTYGADRENATPLTVNVAVGATPLALNLDPGVALTAPLAATQTVAGVAQQPLLKTQDRAGGTSDGWIDGGKLDFRQALNVPFPPAANVGLVSYTGTPDPVLLVASIAAGANAPEVVLVLTNPDAPNPDGTAPATANNDYDGSGTVDADDAALVIGANFNSGVDNTLDDPDAGPPFGAFIGTDDLSNVAPTSSLTYAMVWDRQTGLNLGVPTGPQNFTTDDAAPSVQLVEWTQTSTFTCTDGTEVDVGRVTVTASEPVQPVPDIADNEEDTINEFLFGGLTPDLINDAACAPSLDEDDELDRVRINIGGPNTVNLGGDPDEIILTNMPKSVLLSELSLGPTGGAVDIVPELPLFVDPTRGADVTEPDPLGPAVAYLDGDPEVQPILVDGEWTHIVVHFDQDVFPPAGQTDADLNEVFTVRAVLGWDGTGSNTDNPREVFQWVIAGEDVGIGAGGVAGDPTTVTLKLPGSNRLPEDTFQVWVDYQGASAADVLADPTNLSYIQNAADSPALVDGGTQFDDDVPPGVDVPIRGTITGDNAVPPLYGATVDDTDTGSSAEFQAPFIGLGGREDDQRRLFTQTVKGKLTNGGENAFEDTAVRANLVRLRIASSNEVFERKAVVKDGWIEVRQGSNSEYSDNGPTNGPANDADENNWVNLALKNSAVTGTDFDKWAQSLQKIADALTDYNSALANNKDSKTTDRLYSDWQKAQIAHDRVYQLNPNDNDDYLPGYVEITNGDGKAAADTTNGESDENFNTAQANGNASYGRTATLLKTLSNTQKNGTSFYPVWIHMETGELVDASNNAVNPEFSNNVRNGQLALVSPILGKKSTETMSFEQLDTAYALVDDDGNYKVTVSMDQAAFDAKSTDLTIANDDACILIAVRNTLRDSPQDGEWLQANMCESSFDSYLPFEGDLNRDGTPTTLNIETDNISRTNYTDDGDWFLAPIVGTPARDASVDLNLPWFFIQTRPNDGAPVTLWENDSTPGNPRYGDAVASLGLNQGKEPEVQLAFELGNTNDNANVGSLNLRPGAALAIVGDGGRNYFSSPPSGTGTTIDGDLTEGLINTRSTVPAVDGGHKLFVPVTGGPQNAVLAADAWHLVTFHARDKTVGDIAAANPAVDAMIIFLDPVSDVDSGRDGAGNDRLDGDVDTFVWFVGETPPDYELGDAIGAFIHVNAEVPDFNIDIP